jgi:hypothetical protein
MAPPGNPLEVLALEGVLGRLAGGDSDVGRVRSSVASTRAATSSSMISST